MKILFIAIGAVSLVFLLGYFLHPKAVNLTEKEKDFIGKWVDQSGRVVHIYSDGRASYKFSNSSITGGSVRISENELKIHFGPISKTIGITKWPLESEGIMRAHFDGVEFTKNSVSKAVSTEKLVMTKELGATLNKKTMELLASSLDSGSIRALYDYSSPVLRSQVSEERFYESLSSMFKRKEQLRPFLINFPKSSNVESPTEAEEIYVENILSTNSESLLVRGKYHAVNGRFALLGLLVKPLPSAAKQSESFDEKSSLNDKNEELLWKKIEENYVKKGMPVEVVEKIMANLKATISSIEPAYRYQSLEQVEKNSK